MKEDKNNKENVHFTMILNNKFNWKLIITSSHKIIINRILTFNQI